MTHDGRQSNAMEADGRAYRPEINGELSMLAFRSALHLGKPTQRNHSHLVHLLLTWHPKHAELRRRFTLERAVVMTWEEVLARAGGARPEKLGPFRAAVPSAEALEARKNHSAHIMYCSAVFEIWDEAQEASCMISEFLSPRRSQSQYCFSAEHTPADLSHPSVSDQHGIELNTFPFGLDLAINERWEKTLRTSLAQPKAPRDDTLPMADLCASDTNEGLPNLLKEAMGPPDIQRLAMDAMSEAEFEIRMADTMVGRLRYRRTAKLTCCCWSDDA